MIDDLPADIKAIPQEIFLNTDVLYLSQFLLGKFLITKFSGQLCITKIVETEAYKAPEDRGSHAYGNRKTNRTSTIFESGGIAYIYLCYGLHHMFNIVTGPPELAHAILIRAVEPLEGLSFMQKRRGDISDFRLTNGPGKLCQALGIKTIHNGSLLTDASEPIWIGMNEKISEVNIVRSPRVGIAYAQEDAHLPWRFRIRDNPWTSKPDSVSYL